MIQEKKPTIWEKMGKVDYRWVYALTIILVIIPVIQPIGIPCKTTKVVEDYYDVLDNLQPGSVVAVSLGGGISMQDELKSQLICTWKILFEKDAKVIWFSTNRDGPIMLDWTFNIVKPSQYGKVYGEDYVRLGFTPLGEPGQASFAIDIRSVYPTDYQGTSLDDLPITKDVIGHEDIDLLIFIYTSCTDVEFVIRQWAVPYPDVKVLAITIGGCGPMAAPYIPDQILGFLHGSVGGAELEIVAGLPGPGALINDAKNLGIFGLLIFLILGNASYWGERLTGDS